MNYTRVLKRQRYKLVFKKTRLYLSRTLLVMLILILWCNPYRPIVTKNLAIMAESCITKLPVLVEDNPCIIINYAVPIVAQSATHPKSSPETVLAALQKVTGVNLKQPELVLKSQFPHWPTTNYQSQRPQAENSLLVPPEDKLTVTELVGPPVVALYNTHTGETYALTDGVERLNGKRGGVVQVAVALQQYLEEQRIKTVRVDTIHDQVYNKSYIESEKTVLDLVKKHPQLKIILDIHRDAGRPRKDCFVEINGEKVARIMIVTGSDARNPFPNWQQNLTLARQIANQMDAMYPGLSHGVRVKEGRYNQHHHIGALLLEIGSVENSTEEAIRAAKLLADVLAVVLEENKTELSNEL